MKRNHILCTLTFALCIILVSGQIRVQHGNLWEMYLTGNAENLLLLFKDGNLFVITENLENTVTVPTWEVFKGRGPAELLIVIHNHLTIHRWSEDDMRFYHWLRNQGFRGYFGLRLGSGKTIWMED